MARPMPRPPPVMTATLSLSSISCSSLHLDLVGAVSLVTLHQQELCLLRLCLCHPTHDLLWGYRHFIDLNAERLERVFYSTRHGWWCDHASTFATSFDTVGRKGRGCFVMVDFDGRYFVRCRQQVVNKRSGQVLPISVVAHLFKECGTDALSNATVNLSFQGARVHHRANIMHGDIFEKFDLSCFDIHFHNGNMYSMSHNGIEGTQVL